MEGTEPLTILTIGHSTHTYASFLTLLQSAGVSAIADVRTAPFSRHQPQFNRDNLREALRRDGVSYVFLGKELGGRPDDFEYYSDGIADYDKIATSPNFERGLHRIVEGAKKYRIAAMCSEHDPLDCHRCLLIGRALANREITIVHILQNGGTVTHPEIEERLLEISGRNTDDLFATKEERLAIAYRDRARKVAFAEPRPDPGGPIPAE
jgi:uncharacterized protein (DUF488 family)